MPQRPLPPARNRCPYRVIASDDARISEATRQILRRAQTLWQGPERRAQQRLPLAQLIHMVPLGNDLKPASKPVYVVGKNLALLGLDFFHPAPIVQRFAIVSFQSGTASWIQFLMKITWCRFLRSGWYDSGGKFIKLVAWESGASGELTPS